MTPAAVGANSAGPWAIVAPGGWHCRGVKTTGENMAQKGSRCLNLLPKGKRGAGAGRAYSFVACLSQLIIDHESLSRRSQKVGWGGDYLRLVPTAGAHTTGLPCGVGR